MRLQRIILVVALATAVYMLAPPTSPFFADARERRAAPAAAHQAAKPKPHPAPVKAKGILMTGYTAGTSRFDLLTGLVGRTELNAVVIDVKDDTGFMSWQPRSPGVRAMGSGLPKIGDIRARVKALKARNIYVIGRIVTFKDPVIAQVRPDLAVQDTKGGVWRDRKGLGWADPYSEEVWAYNLDIAREAASVGFDEIQFDYIRFPSDGDLTRMWFPHHDLRAHTQVIHDFLAAARRELSPLGVYLSADVFGLTTLVQDDLGIGQKIELIAQEVDYLSLMLYPSHYNKPEYDIKDPEREPYKTIQVSLADAKRRIAGTRAILRPWLQDFSLAVPYTPVEVRQQIKAAEDAGVDQWLLWNARNRYSEDALRPAGPRATPSPSGSPRVDIVAPTP